MQKLFYVICFQILALSGLHAKKALIFGVTGQDGAYLAELLLEKGYEVHGVKRRSSSYNTARIDHLYQDSHNIDCKFFLHYGDLSDSANVLEVINSVKPDEIYNLGAQSHVRVSFDMPEYTSQVDALGTLRILEAVHKLGLENKTKYYQASTSEMFGLVQEVPQNEKTPFYPRSPYAVAKVYSYWMTVNYREAYNMFACNGILFNHESPRRGGTFLTRKVTMGASRIKLGLQDCLYLGNLEAKRDWGYAKDYVKGMWLVLQQEKPDDYVLATGETHTVREFVEKVFSYLDMELRWEGDGINEVGINTKTDEILVRIDPRYFRPTEVDLLIGDATKARKQLNWKPTVSFDELVAIMVENDLNEAKKTLHAKSYDESSS